ncbi:hypothetical protein ACA910_009542 [Epithemia clementina (nom. ined.)]
MARELVAQQPDAQVQLASTNNPNANLITPATTAANAITTCRAVHEASTSATAQTRSSSLAANAAINPDARLVPTPTNTANYDNAAVIQAATTLASNSIAVQEASSTIANAAINPGARLVPTPANLENYNNEC